MKVLILGCGYVGLTTGCALAYLGHHVKIFDIDQAKIDVLRLGRVPFYERGLQELLAACEGRIRFTSEWSELAVQNEDAIMIAVGTPSLPNGEADLSYVENAARHIAQNLREESCPMIIMKSTVPIGTSKWVKQVMEEERERNGLRGRIPIVSIPEFLREGEALYDTFYPDRIVVGLDSDCEQPLVEKLFEPILQQSFQPPATLPSPEINPKPSLLITNLPSAEMIKYASNSFLAMKISFINEFSTLAEKTGADIADVAKGMGLDKRIGPAFLRAGIGWGGSCFGKDTQAVIQLGKKYACEMKLVQAAIQVNQQQREVVLQKLEARLRRIEGSTIGVLGLSFKPNTDDLRDAPAIDIIGGLLARRANVKVYDPVAMKHFQKQFPELSIEYASSAEEVFSGSDAVILVTEWEEFRHLPYERLQETMKNRVLIDGRNYLDGDQLQKHGYQYAGIGKQQETNPQKVLVTGGAGFIGSKLVTSLLEDDYAVLVVDNLDPFYDPAIKKRNIHEHKSYSRYQFFETDICDTRAMKDIFSTYQPDIVIHLAAKAGVRPSVENPSAYVQTNVVGTTTLLDLSVSYGVKKFIFGSSSSVYGINDKVPFAETDPILSPASPYAATKITGEALCQSYQNCYGLPTIALRFFTVYGPGQRPDLAIQTFTRKMMQDMPIQLFGDGTTSRDYTYIDDIVRGIRRAMDYQSERFEVFNLGNDRPTSLLELVQQLEATLGKKAEVEWLPMQTGDVPATRADLQKSRELLGYQPATSLEIGLKEYVDWYRKQE